MQKRTKPCSRKLPRYNSGGINDDKSDFEKVRKAHRSDGRDIKKGQGAVILADTAQSEIALMVAEEAYRAGAKWVDIRWTNQDLDKMRYKKESVKVLSATQEWEKARMQYDA